MALSSLLDYHGAAPGDVSVAIVDDAKMRRLNLMFRNIDQPTDVLTFVSEQNFDHEPIGEIVVSHEMAARQAQARRAEFDHEIICLTIHGGLHLLGYDDVSDQGRDEMVRLMNDHLIRLGMPTDDEWCSLHPGGAA